MEQFQYYNPDRIIFGSGVRKNVGEECKKRGYSKVLLAVGKGPFRESGLYDEIAGSIQQQGIPIADMGDIDSNPRIDSVREGVNICKKEKVDAVVALGGGSTMDCSKVIAAAATVDDDPWNYLWGHRNTFEKSLDTVMVPTIAATGTDINPFAVVFDTESINKTFCTAECMYPALTIADPEIMVSVPLRLTVWGAMDMMSHTFEFYFNGYGKSTFQNRFSEAIIHSIMENVNKLVKDPKDVYARGELWWCSVMAWGGLTMIGREDPDMAVHTIGEAFVPYYDIHHGACMGVMTPRWMRYAVERKPEIFARFAEMIFGIAGGSMEERAKKGVEAYIGWLKSIGAPDTLQDLTGKTVDDAILREVADNLSKGSDWQVGRLVVFDREGIYEILTSSCEPL